MGTRRPRSLKLMGKGKGHVPIRTCLSCGQKRSKHELIRLGLTPENRLVRDDQGTCRGRGAYVCKNKSCWEKLSRNRHLGRRFRVNGSITIDTALSAE
jgi:predicted RNA-binding protein YlxR (DUF448 family)